MYKLWIIKNLLEIIAPQPMRPHPYPFWGTDKQDQRSSSSSSIPHGRYMHMGLSFYTQTAHLDSLFLNIRDPPLSLPFGNNFPCISAPKGSNFPSGLIFFSSKHHWFLTQLSTMHVIRTPKLLFCFRPLHWRNLRYFRISNFLNITTWNSHL